MSVLIEGTNSFFIGSQAELLTDERETASEWASKHIHHNPALKWVLGKYVEADNANSNKQYWSLADLQMSQPTIEHAPMNILHRPRNIVGAFVATEMMYPKEDHAEIFNPYIEALGVFWKYYFPTELEAVQRAHDEGSLFFSMECVAESITCSGDNGCQETFDYAGTSSPGYCSHLNDHASIKQLNKPHFLGGALVIPPGKPGWKKASIESLSTLVQEHAAEAEKAYLQISEEFPHLSSKEWEFMMAQILDKAKS